MGCPVLVWDGGTELPTPSVWGGGTEPAPSVWDRETEPPPSVWDGGTELPTPRYPLSIMGQKDQAVVPLLPGMEQRDQAVPPRVFPITG